MVRAKLCLDIGLKKTFKDMKTLIEAEKERTYYFTIDQSPSQDTNSPPKKQIAIAPLLLNILITSSVTSTKHKIGIPYCHTR